MGPWCGQCGHFPGKNIVSFSKKNEKKNSAGMVWHTKYEAKVQFKPSSNAFSRNTVCLNAESNLRFGSAAHLNLGLNFGPVLQSSGSNFGNTTPPSCPHLISVTSIPRYCPCCRRYSLTGTHRQRSSLPTPHATTPRCPYPCAPSRH